MTSLIDAIQGQTSTALHADDIKMLRSILTVNDCDTPQQDVKSLNTWTAINQI